MLWDTAGQEEFDAITKAYYRGAQACVVAFSTTDRLSFEAVRKWKKKVWNMILLHGFRPICRPKVIQIAKMYNTLYSKEFSELLHTQYNFGHMKPLCGQFMKQIDYFSRECNTV